MIQIHLLTIDLFIIYCQCLRNMRAFLLLAATCGLTAAAPQWLAHPYAYAAPAAAVVTDNDNYDGDDNDNDAGDW